MPTRRSSPGVRRGAKKSHSSRRSASTRRAPPRRTVVHKAQSGTVSRKGNGFSFGIPKAHAMPAPLGLAKVAGKSVLKRITQSGKHKNLRPGKNIKSVTYANQLMGNTDRINMSTATRANQAMLASNQKKHMISRNKFRAIRKVKVNPPSSRNFISMPRQKRRPNIIQETVTTKQNLVSGLPPVVGTTSTSPSRIQRKRLPKGQKTLFISGATIGGAALFDQANKFFNPFPSAEAKLTPITKIAQNVIKTFMTGATNKSEMTWAKFQAAHPEQAKTMTATQFHAEKNLHLTQKISRKPGAKDTRVNKYSDKQLAAMMGGSIGGTLGVVGIASVYPLPGMGPAGTTQPPVTTTQEPVTTTTQEPDTNVPVGSVPYLESGDMIGAQKDFEAGLAAAAAAQENPVPPTIRYGFGKEVGQANPHYTLADISVYNKATGEIDKKKQWVKLGFHDLATFESTSARGARADKYNVTFAELNTALAGQIGLKAKADTAAKFYKENPVLGKLPRQYQVIIDANKKPDLTPAQLVTQAKTWHEAGVTTQGAVRDDGTYPITITPGGFSTVEEVEDDEDEQ